MSKSRGRVGSVFFLLSMIPALAGAQATGQTPATDPRLQTAEAVVRELYRMVTVAVGDSTDWEEVRRLFLPEAVIAMRATREEMSVFSVQGWIDDFVAFNQRARVIERGFEEKIVRLEPLVFHDIAHVLVLYEARILDSPRPPTRGVDSIELVRKDDRWWIAAITNDLPTEEHPIPPQLEQ
jgi:hypothetical protein